MRTSLDLSSFGRSFLITPGTRASRTSTLRHNHSGTIGCGSRIRSKTHKFAERRQPKVVKNSTTESLHLTLRRQQLGADAWVQEVQASAGRRANQGANTTFTSPDNADALPIHPCSGAADWVELLGHQSWSHQAMKTRWVPLLCLALALVS